MKLNESRPATRQATPAEIKAYARRAKGDPPEKREIVELLDSLDVILAE